MDATHQNTNKQYNECCGRGCLNAATNLLKINYINKTGYFCDCCSGDLLKHQLATKIVEV
jgi:hypothetical protein